MAQPPLGRLRYLYVGSTNVGRDLSFYVDVLGAEKLWHFRGAGAEVAAVRVAEGPWILLADHRPAGNMLPIFLVDDLAAKESELRRRGWCPETGPVEVPDGPCYLFRDPSGNELAILGNSRPDLLVRRYADPASSGAVR
jgi:hypothetical protein